MSQTIKPADYRVAIAHLRRLRDRLGAAAFSALIQIKTPADLEAWIAVWLTDADVARLRNAIKQARYRERHRGTHARLVVDRSTADALHRQARLAGVTTSKFLTNLINGGTP